MCNARPCNLGKTPAMAIMPYNLVTDFGQPKFSEEISSIDSDSDR